MGYCCVVNCHNNGTKHAGKVKFFRFPIRNEEQRNLWIKAVKRICHNGKPWQPTKYARICSAHFVNGEVKPTRNHPSYVPTIFPTNHRKSLGTRDHNRFKRFVQRRKNREENLRKVEISGIY